MRRYSDASNLHSAIHKDLKGIEESFKKLGLDQLKDAHEVEALLKDGKINEATAEYLKHNIQRRTEAASTNKCNGNNNGIQFWSL